MARSNIEANPELYGYANQLNVVFTGLSGLTAWARVEAGQHHPTDVLVGAGLGNFIARFFSHAWIHEKTTAVLITVSLQPAHQRVEFHARF